MHHRVLAAFLITATLPLAAQAKLAHSAKQGSETRAVGRTSAQPSRYLYVWSSTMDTARSAARPFDFLAVMDLQPDGSAPDARYGRIARVVPVPARNTMAHHAEQQFAAGRHFFASSFKSGQLFLFDASSHAEPRFVRKIDSVPGLVQPHSLRRLPNGHILATVQFSSGSTAGRPGALAELDDDGRVLRTSSAADPLFAGAPIRPYGLEIVPSLDRAISTSSPMDTARTLFVMQLWRLSDLHLLHSFLLPASADSANTAPFEPRVLADGRTVLVSTYTCGLYRLMGLETDHPSAELVYSLFRPGAGDQGCAVPSVVGHFWVMPIVYQHRVAVLDVADPRHPKEVSSLSTDTTFFPHWSSSDPLSDRVVITEQGDGMPRVLIARLDPRSGSLQWDQRFREPGAAAPGFDFERVEGPPGVVAAAMPHASVFVP